MVSVTVTVVLCITASAVCTVIACLIQRNRAADLRNDLKKLEEEREELAGFKEENEELKLENVRLLQEKEADKQRIEWVKKAEEQLREAFDSLASKALRQNASEFIERSEEQIKTFVKLLQGDWNTQREQMRNLVEPLGKDLDKLDSQVREMEKRREGAYKSLLDHVSGLEKANRELNKATTTLSQALRSSKARGKWGEVQLRRIAEMSGMVEHVDFDEQVSSETGRPDMVVHLPSGGIIPVDSKAPMEAYLDSVESEDEDKIKTGLRKHASSIRNHIRDLAKKQYWAQFEGNMPEFVVMLIPYESGLSAAFSQDPAILEEGLSKNVVIVSPATLLALLKVVAYGWLQLSLAENAQEIARQGRILMERFGVFAKHLSQVGRKLNDTLNSYNRAVGSMESRVLPSLRRLEDIGAGGEELDVPSQIENMARNVESDE